MILRFHQWKHIFAVGGWNHSFRIIGLKKLGAQKMLVKKTFGPIKFRVQQKIYGHKKWKFEKIKSKKLLLKKVQK